MNAMDRLVLECPGFVEALEKEGLIADADSRLDEAFEIREAERIKRHEKLLKRQLDLMYYDMKSTLELMRWSTGLRYR